MFQQYIFNICNVIRNNSQNSLYTDFKGIVNSDSTFCLHLLTHMSFQTCMSFFLMLNIKEGILKNAVNQTVDGPH